MAVNVLRDLFTHHDYDGWALCRIGTTEILRDTVCSTRDEARELRSRMHEEDKANAAAHHTQLVFPELEYEIVKIKVELCIRR